jgi:dienelactone hydrolase
MWGRARSAIEGAEPASQSTRRSNIHQQLLELAARQEAQRRARFAAVKTQADLDDLQRSLRAKFLGLIGGLPESAGPPPVKKTGEILADAYSIEKLAFESLPGYYVSALLYRPRKISGTVPGIISPCGHSTVGKAAAEYQILHVNLVRRGYAVLTYDPVGQGERSQFWDSRTSASRFNLACGEHAVLGNPLYLLGTSLARYRIWDGIRGLDYLASLPEVDPKQLGCVGNSGGGTLTAYLSALDPRVAAAAICCYITTLPRRMANRIQADPDADPEQDPFGFVSEGIDHAGLLALRTPRPTLVGAAQLDFFPIEGARESFAEAKRSYEAVGAGPRIELIEAAERHGLTVPLRKAVYDFFDRWLARRSDNPTEEFPVTPRPAKDLHVCADGQVSVTFQSRPLLTFALEEFRQRKRPKRAALRDLLRLDSDQAAPTITKYAASPGAKSTTLVLVNGNESRDWRDEKQFLETMRLAYRIAIVDPRGVGQQRLELSVTGHDYADPLVGVEENVAYNAFLVGKTLLGMRVTDVLAAVAQVGSTAKSATIVLCGRRDAALVACLAAAVESTIGRVALEELRLSYLPFFAVEGQPINAASILPGLLRDYGDIPDVLTQIVPRKVLIAAGVGEFPRNLRGVETIQGRFTSAPQKLLDWLQQSE